MSELANLDELYESVVLDHYRNPRNAEPLPAPKYEAKLYNPLCGDETNFQANLADGKISELAVFGRGCAISQASGSVMSEVLEGKKPQTALQHAAQVRALMKGETLTDAEMDALGDMEAMLGVRKYPVRIKCALLPWTVAESAFSNLR